MANSTCFYDESASSNANQLYKYVKECIKTKTKKKNLTRRGIQSMKMMWLAWDIVIPEEAPSHPITMFVFLLPIWFMNTLDACCWRFWPTTTPYLPYVSLTLKQKIGPNTLGSKYSGAMHWHWTHVSLCYLHSHSQLPELSVEGRPTSLEWIMFMDRIFYSSASFFSWLYSLRPSSSATPGLFLTHSVIFITTATATINCRTSWK